MTQLQITDARRRVSIAPSLVITIDGHVLNLPYETNQQINTNIINPTIFKVSKLNTKYSHMHHEFYVCVKDTGKCYEEMMNRTQIIVQRRKIIFYAVFI